MPGPETRPPDAGAPADVAAPLEPVVAAPPPRHLAIGTLAGMAAQVGPLIASAAMSVVIARTLGPSGTGVFSLVLNTFDVVVMTVAFGLSAGVTFYVSRGDWSIGAAFRDTYRAAFVLGTIGMAGGLVFYALTRHSILDGVTVELAVVSLASLPFSLAWALASAIALGRDRYEAYASIQIIQAIVMLLAGVSLAIAFGLAGAVVGFAASQIAGAVFAAFWLKRYARVADVGAAPGGGGLLRKAAGFGFKAWGANLLQLLNYRLDIFIVSAYTARSDVGVYSVAISLTALGWILPSALTLVLFPRTARLDAGVERGELSDDASDENATRAARHTVVMLVPSAVALIALLLVAVPVLYGSEFHRTITLGLILIPGVLSLGIAKVLSAVFSGRGFPIYALYSSGVTVVITVTLYFVLVPRYGATGAAVASTVSYMTSTLLAMYFFRRATGIPLRRALVPTRADLQDYAHAIRHIGARIGARRSGPAPASET